VDEKEKMSRHIRSVEDRQRSIDNRKREQEVITEHKKRERQLIREGKKSQPYYLKKSDLRREILVKKYESMGAKERVKALARRRKKSASKEKKGLPWARRSLGETTGRDGVTGVHEFS
jgi:ribosomal RNA-processing protein 36